MKLEEMEMKMHRWRESELDGAKLLDLGLYTDVAGDTG